uniref:Uncharacterized protein n=1 Tax=Meloidogyne enterolobii TaxID=390850 RepID=A0A6V7XNY1_MELEN|nr:unnamed protein product [Meloidogyne enterolobii]
MIISNLFSFSFEKYENIFGIINKTTNLLEHPSKENATISILKIQLGKNDTMFATLTDINEKEWEYVSSTKFLISNLFDTKDKEKEKTLQKITEGNEALSLFGLDMDLWNEGSTILDTMKVPERSCHLSLKFNQNKFNASKQCVRILFKKQLIINGLGARSGPVQNIERALNFGPKKTRSGRPEKNEARKERLPDSKTPTLLIIFVNLKISQIKNNPKSDFAKSCSNKGPGRHGIEFRVFATRVGFQIFKKEGRYRITYRVDVIIGFSYSEYTIKFGK